MRQMLIIRPGAIGDSLLTFPIIQVLRARYSSPHITFVSNAAVLPLALDAGLAEEVYDYGAALWSDLFSTAGIRNPRLQALLQHIDVAICWLRDVEGIVERNLHAIGIKHIIIAPGRPPASADTHIVNYLARTIWPDEPPLLAAHNHFPLYSKEEEEKCHYPATQRIAIHPGSGGAYKCWPVANFATVITTLWQRNIPVLLLAGPADHERLTDLLRLLPVPITAALLSILQDVPLLTIAQELRQCKGYLGNDAGITHLAALLSIPTIVLFGPSNPKVWRPYGKAVKVLYEPLLANLLPSIVLYTVEEFFSDL